MELAHDEGFRELEKAIPEVLRERGGEAGICKVAETAAGKKAIQLRYLEIMEGKVLFDRPTSVSGIVMPNFNAGRSASPQIFYRPEKYKPDREWFENPARSRYALRRPFEFEIAPIEAEKIRYVYLEEILPGNRLRLVFTEYREDFEKLLEECDGGYAELPAPLPLTGKEESFRRKMRKAMLKPRLGRMKRKPNGFG